jgi:SAM-dependent methyltransferase
MFDSVWQTVFASQSWGKYPSEDLIRFVARNFYGAPDRSAVRVLEVGCGPGANMWFLAREGFGFAGIDGSALAIEQATARLDAEIPGWAARGSLHIGDVETLPFEDGEFDAVIDNECVYCNSFKSSVRIYNELARVLKPGGKLFSRTFEHGTWGEHTGTRLEENYYLADEGPLGGKGASRFTGVETVPDLIAASIRIDAIERVSRTENCRQNVINELLIFGTKVQ